MLQNSGDNRDCENQLVDLLSFEQFPFIKKLIRNRDAVMYCTLLAQAQSKEEKASIEDKMQSEPKLSLILHQLWETSADDNQMEHSGIETTKRANHESASSSSSNRQSKQRDKKHDFPSSSEGEKVHCFLLICFCR